MYHFLNCMALAFAPHVICYKATKLSAEGIQSVAGTRNGRDREK